VALLDHHIGESNSLLGRSEVKSRKNDAGIAQEHCRGMFGLARGRGGETGLKRVELREAIHRMI
jgi:hypothetical protein